MTLGFDLAFVVVAMKAVTLTLGTILAWLSYRAFRRTGATALRALAVGIGLLTAGAVVGGLVHQLLGLSLLAGVGVQSAFTAGGFAVLTYSLYVDDPPGERSIPPGPMTEN